MSDKLIRRAHCLIATIEGDTLADLVDAIHSMAKGLERGKYTTGCIGGYSTGATYSYQHDPNMTHDLYIEAIDAYFTKKATT